MKRRHFISFAIPRPDTTRVLEALDAIGCRSGFSPAPCAEGLASFAEALDATDSRLALVRDLIAREGLRPFERVDDHYTDDELRSFPLLDLSVDRKEIAPFGPSHGTTYDLTAACPRCGCGAVQTSPFYGPARSFPRTGLLCCSSSETFVGAALAEALKSAGVTGLELRQARSSRGHEPLPWWQVLVHHTLPRMSQRTKGVIVSVQCCPECQRDGRYHTVLEPEQIVYDAATVVAAELPDVVQTWECFAASYKPSAQNPNTRYAPPAILVKPRVFDIFRELKVKHARFVPVRILDDDTRV